LGLDRLYLILSRLDFWRLHADTTTFFALFFFAVLGFLFYVLLQAVLSLVDTRATSVLKLRGNASESVVVYE
jgi:hypothetical protein